MLCDEPMDGARNMARDEALLRAVGAGGAPPVLRLYAWQPFTLSLGYGQRFSDVDGERLQARGWGVVRRLTGGRAILHADELTYCLALPGDHPLARGGVIDSYRRISAALLEVAHSLGVFPRALEATGSNLATAMCFETPSHYELTVAGRKLVGSAQARRHGGLLQHGSLPLSGDIGRIADVLAFADESARIAAKTAIRARATTLSEAAGREIGRDEAGAALAAAAAGCFGVRLVRSLLTEPEMMQAETLAREVYGRNSWTARR